MSLEQLGYEPTQAVDGEDALDKMGNPKEFGVVLLDLQMPGLSGEEVARQLPHHGPKVVFLTARPMHEVGSALNQGAHYYLPKGATREQLSLLLESLQAA